jgi:hypothetical protein
MKLRLDVQFVCHPAKGRAPADGFLPKPSFVLRQALEPGRGDRAIAPDMNSQELSDLVGLGVGAHSHARMRT